MVNQQERLTALLFTEVIEEPVGVSVLEPSDVAELEAFILAGSQIPDTVNGVKIEVGTLSSIREKCIEFRNETMPLLINEGS